MFNSTNHFGNWNVLETNDYYPYGMLMDDGAKEVQPYKYSGKELDRMHCEKIFALTERNVRQGRRFLCM